MSIVSAPIGNLSGKSMKNAKTITTKPTVAPKSPVRFKDGYRVLVTIDGIDILEQEVKPPFRTSVPLASKKSARS